jgi:hypothetical protein
LLISGAASPTYMYGPSASDACIERARERERGCVRESERESERVCESERESAREREGVYETEKEGG